MLRSQGRHRKLCPLKFLESAYMIIELWGVRGSLPTPMTPNEFDTRIRTILERAVSSGLNSTDDIDAFLTSLDRVSAQCSAATPPV
jgi:hypothetical protein